MDPDIDGISTMLDKSLSLDLGEKTEAYHRHLKDGKAAAKAGDMSKGLEEFKKAYKIHPSEKLMARIKRIEDILAEQGDESEDDDFLTINGLALFKDLHDKLYDYQRDGISFLYGLYRDGRKGGILADDMGLGKTIQIISFLSGMYDAGHVKHTLLVMPTSLITNWTKEFGKWTPGMRVKEFHGSSKKERTRNLEKVQRRDGVIITTFNMLLNNWEQLASYNGCEFKWDYMILDEAHKIKSSSTKTAKSAQAVPAKNRILLTGTPVQNNLRELWALFDFACQGTLLGTAKTFKSEYDNPITRAREKDATPGEKALGAKMSENLMTTIRPYFLRRTKAEVQKKQAAKEEMNREQHSDSNNSQGTNGTKSGTAVMPKLTRKNDLVVWTYLSKVQEDIYKQFLSLDHIKELLTTTRSPLAELNVLKKVCDHPRLLSIKAVAELGLQECLSSEDQQEVAGSSIEGISDETLISESGKMTFLLQLLLQLREEGHRTLVFARFRKVLDILQRVLINRGFKVMRLDGMILKMAERERLIQMFQKDGRYSVFLLTTQVGGVGITLTSADRVVIYDPSWNPATDAQAVDRAYRIGQKHNVVVYRLITCGTVEEKIYRRQVFKDSLIRQTTGDKKNPFRYFSKQELKELFTLEETRSSNTQLLLQTLHSRHRMTDPELDEHIAHLHSMEMFGITDHDLMFSQVANCDDEDPEDEESQRYIETRVQKAQDLMRVESELHGQLAESMGASTEPAWLRQMGQNGAAMSNVKRERAKPRPPFPSSPRYDDVRHSPVVVVDLDQSGSVEEQEDVDGAQSESVQMIDDSDEENQAVGSVEEDKQSQTDVAFQSGPAEEHHGGSQNLSMQMVNITLDDGVAENQAEEKHDSPRDASLNGVLCAFKAQDASFSEVMDTSITKDASLGSDVSLNAVPCGLEERDASISEVMDLPRPKDISPGISLKNKRLSVLQLSPALSMNEDGKINSYNNSSQHESPQHGDFVLELEDSCDDMFTGEDLDEDKIETQEQKLLSRLQLEGSFSVEKSLNVGREHVSVNVSELDESAVSLITRRTAAVIDDSEEDESAISLMQTKKRRAAVFSDSEAEEADHTHQPIIGPLDHSFAPVLEASSSTPLRAAPLGSRSRMSSGGNISVASRRSLVRSLMEDVDDDEESSTRQDEEDSVGAENVEEIVKDDSEGSNEEIEEGDSEGSNEIDEGDSEGSNEEIEEGDSEGSNEEIEEDDGEGSEEIDEGDSEGSNEEIDEDVSEGSNEEDEDCEGTAQLDSTKPESASDDDMDQ